MKNTLPGWKTCGGCMSISTNHTAPVVYMDERFVKLLRETSQSIAAAPGRRQRIDFEYGCNGTVNIFMLCEPLAGWRQHGLRHSASEP